MMAVCSTLQCTIVQPLGKVKKEGIEAGHKEIMRIEQIKPNCSVPYCITPLGPRGKPYHTVPPCQTLPYICPITPRPNSPTP